MSARVEAKPIHCPISSCPNMRAMNIAMTSNMYTFAVIAPIKLAVRIVATSISVKQAAYIPYRRLFYSYQLLTKQHIILLGV